MADSPTPTPAAYISPFPDAGGLYLLVAGIVLGVLLGPAVMGRVLPGVYQDVFVGGADIARQLNEQQTQNDEQLKRLTDTGVTEAAIDEQGLMLGQQVAVLRAQLDEAQRARLDALRGWTSALVLAVIAVMMIEALVSPDVKAGAAARVSPTLGRLVTARYALVALWIAVVLAQPRLLTQLPIVFAALLILVALGAALVPLGKKV
jgi:hypothetical protein